MRSTSIGCTQYICSRWKTLLSVALIAAIAYHSGQRSSKTDNIVNVIESTPCPESSPAVATTKDDSLVKDDSLGPLNLVLEQHVDKFWKDGDPQVCATYA
jgi:hypothetical protein